jgi:hypothetical protein
VISACALSALSGTSVKRIFHGASDMNLSFVVDENDADHAVRRLHLVMFPAPATRDSSVQFVSHRGLEPAALNAVEA